ncbi:MAG TPA: hypothetical protein ENI95_14550 [Chloroflexi bacterium]|nr:hypothetical protein [Chloroflexota bacterium]
MSLLDGVFDERRESEAQPPPSYTPEGKGGAVLAVDIGNVHTRAVLLDVVDGMYRFVARGETPTTASAPWEDVLVGLYRALESITESTGRRLIDEEEQLIMPERDNFFGVSTFAATVSAGKPIRAILVGLMPDVSLISGKRAADSTYLSLVDVFSLADRRTEEQRLDALLKTDVDLVLIVGGTDGGAVESLRKQIDILALAYSLSDSPKPTVLYAGNADLREEVREKLGEEVGLHVIIADNVRPTLEVEHLESAQARLASLYHAQKARSTSGLGEIGGWTDEGIYPTAHSFGRLIHILGRVWEQDVLGIDVGSAATAVAASLRRQDYLNVFGELGIGHSAQKLLEQVRPQSLTRWLTYEPEHPDDVLDYVWNKYLFPHTVPATPGDLEIEYAMAREIVRNATLNARTSWRNVSQKGLLPPFGTILLSGATLTRPPHYGWSALIVLDALLPLGITRLLADPYGMASALGAIAPSHPTAVVQALETGAFVELGTLVSLSGRARRGEVVLRGEVRTGDEAAPRPFEVRYGTVARIPLPYEAEAEVTLQPRRLEIAGSPRRVTKLRVRGGELGLVVDARGRPWRFPRSSEARRKLMRDWLEAITREEEL